jgi:hypothetical protein
VKYRVFLDGGWYDEAKYPIPPAPVEPCATECRHTAVPDLYHEWQEWCEVASKTHRQVRCPACSLWAIWMPKAEADAYERRVMAEMKARSDAVVKAAVKKARGKRK